MTDYSKDFLAGRMEQFLQSRLYEETLAKPRAFCPSVTISRQMGAGLEPIKQPLIEYLDEVDETDDKPWAIFDQALVGKIIEENRLDSSVEPYIIEDTKFPIVEALEEVLNLHPSEWTLFNYTANTIRKLCLAGHAIVVGRAGNFVTADLKNTFHIRLVASLEKRSKEIQQRFDLNRSKANSLIKETDKGRSKYVKRYTGSDINDSGYYDLVINTDNLTEDLLVKMIADSLLEWALEQQRNQKNPALS